MDVGPLIDRDEPHSPGGLKNSAHRPPRDVQIEGQSEKVLTLRISALRDVLVKGPEPGGRDHTDVLDNENRADDERQDERLESRPQKLPGRGLEGHYPAAGSTPAGISCQTSEGLRIALAVMRSPWKNSPGGM